MKDCQVMLFTLVLQEVTVIYRNKRVLLTQLLMCVKLIVGAGVNHKVHYAIRLLPMTVMIVKTGKSVYPMELPVHLHPVYFVAKKMVNASMNSMIVETFLIMGNLIVVKIKYASRNEFNVIQKKYVHKMENIYLVYILMAE